jgi:hypothetical protein
MNLIAKICTLIAVTSCSSVPAFPVSDGGLPQINNRATMLLEADAQKFQGIGVVSRKSSINFTFHAPKDTVQFTVTLCNGEEYFPNPENGKPVKWTYLPTMYVGNLGSCFLTATALTKNGESSVGVVEFHQGLEETLPAVSKCNLRTVDRIGAELCQSRAKLLQVIEFDTEVVYSELTPGCVKLEKAFGAYAYQYNISEGWCVYKFMDKQKRVFRLTTFGYTTITDALPSRASSSATW